MSTDVNDLRRRAAAWYYDDQFGFAAPPPQTDPEVVRNPRADKRIGATLPANSPLSQRKNLYN